MSDEFEVEIAMREAHEIDFCERYFEARKLMDSELGRRIFNAGFRRGWDACNKARNMDTKSPEAEK